jgi:hypothetical protein
VKFIILRYFYLNFLILVLFGLNTLSFRASANPLVKDFSQLAQTVQNSEADEVFKLWWDKTLYDETFTKRSSPVKKDSFNWLLHQIKDELGLIPNIEPFSVQSFDFDSEGNNSITNQLVNGFNIIVDLPGEDSKWIVLTAHYDTYKGMSFISPGADDNGSGVAALLGFMKKFSNKKLKTGLKFIFFDLEEQSSVLAGLEGSLKHLEQSLNLNQYLYNINIDMIGYDPKKTNTVSLGFCEEEYRNLAQRNKEIVTKLKPYFERAGLIPVQECRMSSDHSSFLNKSIPALEISELKSNFNNCHHMPCDKPEILSFEYFNRIVTGLNNYLLAEVVCNSKNICAQSSVK